MYFKEFSELGFNALTLSVVVLTSLTFWQLRAYTIQAHKVWRDRSAESVSLVFASTVCTILFAFGIYGIQTQSLVLIVNGLVSFPAFVTCVGAFKYGEVKKIDIAVAVIGGIGLLTFLLPINSAYIFLAFALAVVIPLTDELRKLYDVGKRGVISGELLTTFMVKNFFFTIFAFTLPGEEPVLQACAPIWLVISVWLLVKWVKCPR